jgi:hypothetical protein
VYFLPRNSWYTVHTLFLPCTIESQYVRIIMLPIFLVSHMYCQITFTVLLMLNKLKFIIVLNER